MIGAAKTPAIDWLAAMPVLVLFGGAVVVLLAGLIRGRFASERLVPGLSLLALVTSASYAVAQWGDDKEIFVASGSQGTMVVDKLAIFVTVLVAAAGVATVLLSAREEAVREARHGEYHALLLVSAAGMVVLGAAQNLVTLFVGLEMLSIPLYVLCATRMSKERSLESGLKYLIIGSLGSATLLYGLALLYGAAGDTDLRAVAKAVSEHSTDSLVIAGIALSAVGLAFKASIAPFHQWTPDVYEGAPTPITTFMAAATKVATFAAIFRLFGTALVDAQDTWAPALAALAAISIIVGNVGALGQDSLKRLLAWSSIAQAGYMLAGVVVLSALGAEATLFYLAGYGAMTIAAFAVVVARERESVDGDQLSSLNGLGQHKPLQAWVMTIAMLGLAGMPATAGFVGKITLIGAAADGGYTWLGILIVVGSLISLAYYLRVVAAIWATPADPDAESGRDAGFEVGLVAFVFGALTIALGVLPSLPLRLAEEAGRALGLV